MKINLLPPPPPVMRVRVGVFALIMASLVALAAYWAVLWRNNEYAMTTNRRWTFEQNNSLTLMQAKWQKLQSEQQNLRLVQQMDAIRANSGRASTALSDVLRDLPPMTTILRLNYSGGVIDLQAGFASLTESATIIKTLQADPAFASVAVSAVMEGDASGSIPVASPATANSVSHTSGVSVTFTIQMAKPHATGGTR